MCYVHAALKVRLSVFGVGCCQLGQLPLTWSSVDERNRKPIPNLIKRNTVAFFGHSDRFWVETMPNDKDLDIPDCFFVNKTGIMASWACLEG